MPSCLCLFLSVSIWKLTRSAFVQMSFFLPCLIAVIWCYSRACVSLVLSLPFSWLICLIQPLDKDDPANNRYDSGSSWRLFSGSFRFLCVVLCHFDTNIQIVKYFTRRRTNSPSETKRHKIVTNGQMSAYIRNYVYIPCPQTCISVHAYIYICVCVFVWIMCVFVIVCVCVRVCACVWIC